MGTTYWSHSVRGIAYEHVDRTLRGWLEAKGYEEISDEPLFELDAEIERGYFLFGNDQWTVVAYSEIGELDRVTHELGAKLEAPVLELWAHDSDIWGYEVHVDGAIVSAFHSNPRYFGEEEPAKGPNDPDRVVDVLALDTVNAAKIVDVQRTRRTFTEEVCREFAELLGAAPAAGQYGYLLHGEADASADGFDVVHRRFRKAGRSRLAGFDLHRIDARSGPQSHDAAGSVDLASMVGPGQALLIRMVSALFRVLTYPLMLWLKLRYRSTPELAGVFSRNSRRRDGDLWIDEPTRSRLRLIEGASPSEGPGLLPFSIDDLEVMSYVGTPQNVRMMLTEVVGFTLLEDDNFFIGDLPAKRVRWEQAGAGEGPATILEQVFIQTPLAIVIFAIRNDAAAATELAERALRVIATFEAERS